MPFFQIMRIKSELLKIDFNDVTLRYSITGLLTRRSSSSFELKKLKRKALKAKDHYSKVLLR